MMRILITKLEEILNAIKALNDKLDANNKLVAQIAKEGHSKEGNGQKKSKSEVLSK